MRFSLVLIIWLVFVGGLQTYLNHRQAAAPAAPPRQETGEPRHNRHLSLELTPTFTAGADPFALRGNTGLEQPVRLLFNGAALPVTAADLTRGRPLQITALPAEQEGRNELVVMIDPPAEEQNNAYGIRVRVLSGAAILVDRTLWAADGAPVAGMIDVVADPERQP